MTTTSVDGPRRATRRIEVREQVTDTVRKLVHEVVDELRKFYDEVDESFADSLLESAARPADSDGYFTVRKRLFSLWTDGTPIAFTVATVKRGGSVKIGPTAVTTAWRRQGMATRLRDVVEQRLFADGVRKLYMTVSAHNHPALEFNLGRGFRIEGVLGGQYRPRAAELILGKFASWTPGGRLVGPTGEAPAPKDGSATRLKTPSPELLRDFLAPRMAGLYEGVDESFYDAVAHACRSHRQSYTRKGKCVFISTGDAGVVGLAVYVPKRGGAAKLSPFFAESAESAEQVHAQVLQHAIAESRRRLYVHVPVAMPHLICVLHRLGYSIEASLREPYRAGVDVISLGREIL